MKADALCHRRIRSRSPGSRACCRIRIPRLDRMGGERVEAEFDLYHGVVAAQQEIVKALRLDGMDA